MSLLSQAPLVIDPTLGFSNSFLDDSLPEVHITLGYVYQFIKKQPEQAVAEMERAVALDPNNADGYAILADILHSVGRSEDAIGLIEKAMRLNPHYPYGYLHVLGIAYAATKRYEGAIATLKRVLARNPNYMFTHLYLAYIYSELGREEEARAEAAEVLRLSPNFSLEGLRQILPVADQEERERSLNLLRKAGLK